jgi:sugar lactone lactonase YvrE
VIGLGASVHASHSRRVAAILVSMVLLGVFSMIESRSSAQTSTPTLERVGIIRTTPFRNTRISMGDGEGSAYVAKDRSLWLADDNRSAIFEVGRTTGKLKRVIHANAFRSTGRLGGGARAGRARSGDFEAMAYDAAKDVLYLFSGACCMVRRPTVFRLTRDRKDGLLWPDSWQPLKRDTDFSAAGWNPADGRIYVGEGPDIRTYDYRRNATGDAFQVPGLTGILGTGFSGDGSQMYVVTNQEELHAVDWATKILVPGWSFDLTPFQILDSRAVERIGGRFYVLDGASRKGNDRLEFAVFKFDVQQ